MTERYAWRGGDELLLRHGTGSAVTLLILPALFEEANRMRRFTVSLMRGLAGRGIGSVLPDLPGTGESLVPLSDVSLGDWMNAAGAIASNIRATGSQCLTVAIRGGALLDGVGDGSWRLAPETGERVLRDLVRATALSGGPSAKELDAAARNAPTRLAGNLIAPGLYTGLVNAPLPAMAGRMARLDGDTAAADVTLSGERLWRAAEPGDDPEMVRAAVADIAEWVNACVA